MAKQILLSSLLSGSNVAPFKLAKMKTLNELTTQRIVDFLNGLRTEVVITDYVREYDDIDFDNAYNSIYDIVQDNGGFNVEIIYYANAIQYLKENDCSLMESLEIAEEYGYELKNLNSEVLASLLASRNAMEDFGDLQNEIDTFFSELAEELKEEETN